MNAAYHDAAVAYNRINAIVSLYADSSDLFLKEFLEAEDGSKSQVLKSKRLVDVKIGKIVSRLETGLPNALADITRDSNLDSAVREGLLEMADVLRELRDLSTDLRGTVGEVQAGKLVLMKRHVSTMERVAVRLGVE